MSQLSYSHLFYNGTVYTIDQDFSIASALAVEDGIIKAVGPSDQLRHYYSHLPAYNLEGACVYPGFIDAHCHFLWYGLMKKEIDLKHTFSYEEVLQRLAENNSQSSEWVLGRGWDQNRWPTKEYPRKEPLDRMYPDRPVLLVRVDGHAAVANSKALELAGIKDQEVDGGLIERDDRGEPTGLLIDKAIDLVRNVIPPDTLADKEWALKQAEQDCFAHGLTTVDDAQMDPVNLDLIRNMQERGDLRMKVYGMLMATKANNHWLKENGIICTERLTVRSLKQFADGALGSRGALMLAPYYDDPANKGLQLESDDFYLENINDAFHNGWQINTHCIGDAAVRKMLDMYGSHLKGYNDYRWRIEHCQVVHPADFKKFGQYNIVPSVQPSHATSDMAWAEERLGSERISYAYANRQLLDQTGKIAIGSDFPIEEVAPLAQFHAAVFRQDKNQQPEGGFQPQNRLTRQEALKGLTIWAAHANFEEHEKGSIESGKKADLVVLDQDLMKASFQNILDARVIMTIVNGEVVYQK